MEKERLSIIAAPKYGLFNHKISPPVFDILLAESDLTGRIYAKVAISRTFPLVHLYHSRWKNLRYVLFLQYIFSLF